MLMSIYCLSAFEKVVANLDDLLSTYEISPTALHYDLTLLTFNSRHFQRIPDLTLYTSNDQ